MDNKNIFTRGDYWKSVLKLGVGFAVVINIVSVLFEYGGFHFNEYFSDKIAAGNWFRFLLGQVFGAFVYGVIIAYGQFRVKQKKDAASR